MPRNPRHDPLPDDPQDQSSGRRQQSRYDPPANDPQFQSSGRRQQSRHDPLENDPQYQPWGGQQQFVPNPIFPNANQAAAQAAQAATRAHRHGSTPSSDMVMSDSSRHGDALLAAQVSVDRARGPGDRQDDHKTYLEVPTLRQIIFGLRNSHDESFTAEIWQTLVAWMFPPQQGFSYRPQNKVKIEPRDRRDGMEHGLMDLLVTHRRIKNTTVEETRKYIVIEYKAAEFTDRDRVWNETRDTQLLPYLNGTHRVPHMYPVYGILAIGKCVRFYEYDRSRPADSRLQPMTARDEDLNKRKIDSRWFFNNGRVDAAPYKLDKQSQSIQRILDEMGKIVEAAPYRSRP